MINIPENLCCEFCSKQYTTIYSYRQHYIRCKSNPNKIICKPTLGMTGKTAWNKGLTKDSDDRVKKNGEGVSKTLKIQFLSGHRKIVPMSDENRKKLSERQSLFNTGGKSKWFNIGGQKVQGTYEKQFAEHLEKENIKWEKIKTHNHIFKYQIDNSLKSYAPDFWLPELNLYVEIKGFWWGNDEQKMNIVKEQHDDKNLVVLFGKDKLDKICENIKQNLPLEPVWSW